MAIYIFWVFSGRRSAGKPVLTVEKDYWSDWLELRDMLRETAYTAWFKYNINDKEDMLIVIDRLKHKPKRPAYRDYSQEMMSYMREHKAIFKVTFNPRTEQITVKTAQFAQEFSSLIEEFYNLEKGIKWKVPPVIPKRTISLKYLMMMESSVTPNSYIPSLKLQYSFTDDPKYWEKKSTYVVKPKRHYS